MLTFSLMAFCSRSFCSSWSTLSKTLSFIDFIPCIFFLIAVIVLNAAIAILTEFFSLKLSLKRIGQRKSKTGADYQTMIESEFRDSVQRRQRLLMLRMLLLPHNVRSLPKHGSRQLNSSAAR